MERHVLFVMPVRASPRWAGTAVVIIVLFVGGVVIVVLHDEWWGVAVGGWAPRWGRGLGLLLLLRHSRRGRWRL